MSIQQEDSEMHNDRSSEINVSLVFEPTTMNPSQASSVINFHPADEDDDLNAIPAELQSINNDDKKNENIEDTKPTVNNVNENARSKKFQNMMEMAPLPIQDEILPLNKKILKGLKSILIGIKYALHLNHK